MFYGTTGETSEKESPGAEGSLNSSRASVNFPEVKSKVGGTCIINCYCNSLLKLLFRCVF